MSVLSGIRKSVQQVAEAISIALGVEVEIVDNKLNILGGTGPYRDQIGQKEEGGDVEGEYLYARVLRSGVTQYVEDARKDEDYDVTGKGYTVSGELAEICTPIVLDGKIIGIIGLVAFSEEQKRILADKNRNMTDFVEKMADLLAAKADQQETLENVEVSRNEMSTVLETTHEGIFALDQKGYVKHCNNRAATLFDTTKRDLIGRHISKLMPGSPAIKVLETGRGYTENEEIFKVDGGQHHFIVTVKPFCNGDEIDGVVVSFRDITEAQKLVYNFSTRAIKNTVDDIIGTSEKIMIAKKQALITARGNSTVLITGESGTGKEMFAKAIHYASSRSDHPFITVNCGAIPENLLESELFGYEKGAFTGANAGGKVGLMELADGGTLLLDEISEIPVSLQAKLLTAIQEKRITRVGGTKPVNVDFRLIAASNRQLDRYATEGKFRMDLYYRLNVVNIIIPPLRERKEDIIPLLEYYTAQFSAKYNISRSFSPQAVDILTEYPWPGNVRELANVTERVIVTSSGSIIGAGDLPEEISKRGKSPEETSLDDIVSLSDEVEKLEADLIIRAYEKYRTTTGVAGALGISQPTAFRKIEKYVKS